MEIVSRDFYFERFHTYTGIIYILQNRIIIKIVIIAKIALYICFATN